MRRKVLISLGLVCLAAAFAIGLSQSPLAATTVLVPLNGRLLWPSTNGSIPSGHIRDTAYDDRFLQGGASGFTAPANGGSSSPTHTPIQHLHNGVAHTHGVSSSIKEATTELVEQLVDFSPPFIVHQALTLPAGHFHPSATSTATTITYGNTTPTLAGADAAPKFIRLIVIKPETTPQDIPDDAVCFTANTSLPTGFAKYTAADDRFIRGAEAAGDGGGTGGSATHGHTSDHTHAPASHGHAQKNAAAANTVTESPTTSPTTAVLLSTHHKITLGGNSTSLSSDDGTVDDANGEPAFVELMGIQNTSGSATTSEDVIVGFVGDEEDIPTGWELYASTTNRQIRSTITDGDVEAIGGSDDHDHTTTTHGHTHSGAHSSHAAINSQFSSADVDNTPDDVKGLVTGPIHKHTWTDSATTPTLQTNTFTVGSSDGRLEYRTIIWIKRVAVPGLHIKGGTHLQGGIFMVVGLGMIGAGVRRRA